MDNPDVNQSEPPHHMPKERRLLAGGFHKREGQARADEFEGEGREACPGPDIYDPLDIE
jgi:hypothetical protein